MAVAQLTVPAQRLVHKNMSDLQIWLAGVRGRRQHLNLLNKCSTAAVSIADETEAQR